MSFTSAVPDIDLLLAAVNSGAQTRALTSEFHGPRHWRDVARTGQALAERTDGADVAVVFCFALLHDTQRLNDDDDPGHGPRAAGFAAQLLARGLIHLADEPAGVLLDAIQRHTTAGTTDEPTSGCCWDADRLTLWRVYKRPRAEFLSTAAARAASRTPWSLDLLEGEDAGWSRIHDAYAHDAVLDVLPPTAAGQQPLKLGASGTDLRPTFASECRSRRSKVNASPRPLGSGRWTPNDYR